MRLTLLLLLLAAPVQAGQPYSQSLAQCAALYDTSNRMSPERRSGSTGRKLTAMRDTFYAEAVRQARREGRRKPKVAVADLYRAAATDWDSRGLWFVFSDEGRDWSTYCRKFGQHLGLKLPE